MMPMKTHSKYSLLKNGQKNVIVKSKVPLDEPEKKKRKISAVPSSSS